jgi:glycosyltransferase involved in cell wall biosynthesis
METPRLLVIASLATSLTNFRLHMMRALQGRGFEVFAAAPESDENTEASLKNAGIQMLLFQFRRTGLNPFKDFRGIAELVRSFYRFRFNVVMPYTIKPVIYTCLVARLFPRIVVVPIITGVGIYFTEGSKASSVVKWLVSFLYRVSLGRANAVIFQNPDDCAMFVDRGFVARSKCTVVDGSGVHLGEFISSEVPTSVVRILMVCRLLRSKGVYEYLEAAKICKAMDPSIHFVIAGPHDSSPDGVHQDEFQRLISESGVTYLGSLTEVQVKSELTRSSIVVLPSYREGVPRTILEAMATGRPIVVTDVPGCRETVQPDINGLMVPVRDAKALAAAILSLSNRRDQLGQMGRASRRICEERFDVNRVNMKIAEIVERTVKLRI